MLSRISKTFVSLSIAALAVLSFAQAPPPPGGGGGGIDPLPGYNDPAHPTSGYRIEIYPISNDYTYTATIGTTTVGLGHSVNPYEVGITFPHGFQPYPPTSEIWGAYTVSDQLSPAYFSANLSSTVNTPFSWFMNPFSGAVVPEAKLELRKNRVKVRIWFENDTTYQTGNYRSVTLYFVGARKCRATMLLFPANKYPNTPQHGSYDSVAFTPPNSAGDVRDVLDAIATSGNDNAFTAATGEHRSSSLSSFVSDALYPLSGDWDCFVNFQEDCERKIWVKKDADGWYRTSDWSFVGDPPRDYVDLTLYDTNTHNDYEMKVRTSTITNLGNSGPYPLHGTATANVAHEHRLKGFGVTTF